MCKAHAKWTWGGRRVLTFVPFPLSFFFIPSTHTYNSFFLTLIHINQSFLPDSR